MTSYRRALYEQYLSHRNGVAGTGHEEQCRHQARYLARLLRRYLPHQRNIPCLDLGCGGGNFLYFLRCQGFLDLQGVDVSQEQVALARGLGLPVTQVDVFEFLQACGRTYGLISALDLLEHLHKEELVELVGLIRERLDPGGIFLGRTPNGGSPLGAGVCFGDFTHETILTPESLRQVLRQGGFKEIRCFEQRPLPLGPVSTLRSALWAAIRLLHKFQAGAEGGGFGPEILTRVFWWAAAT